MGGSSLFGGLRSSAFRPSTFPMFDVTRGSLLLFGISSRALPVWDQKNEAAQSVAHSDRARRDRHKNPSELTSSIVPQGTSLHRLAEARLPFCSCDRLFQQAGQAVATALSLVQRNSVPSLQRRCMMTARQRARARWPFAGRAGGPRSWPRPSATTISAPGSAAPGLLHRVARASWRRRTARRVRCDCSRRTG